MRFATENDFWNGSPTPVLAKQTFLDIGKLTSEIRFANENDFWNGSPTQVIVKKLFVASWLVDLRKKHHLTPKMTSRRVTHSSRSGFQS